ncbi:TIGR01906 family membrane protein [Enterococcus hirae]|nr:TIGR01906 family membrane protein [Enterococcus hirae]
MRKTKWVWGEYAGLICLFFMLISLAIAITINFRFLYELDIKYLNILDHTTLDQETLLKNFDQLMAYLNNPFQKELSLQNFPISSNGAHHFYEVKKLFLLNYFVLLLTLIPSIYYLFYLKRHKRFWRLVQPFKIGMLVPIVFGFFMLVGFDRFFILFHETFFNNDDWLFDPTTDPIINVLPEQFFMHSFILFFILIELFFAFFVIIGKRELKRS